MSRTLRPFIAGAVVALLSACASSSRIAPIEPTGKDIPAELLTKFEVVEAGQPVVTPSPLPKVGKKSRKGAVTKVVAPFAYPQRRIKVDPIWVGEKQTLEITYLGLAAGTFVTEVLPNKVIANRPVYHFKATAESSSVMNLFYRLNDTIESFWDYEGLFSHRFHMALDETKQKRDALELFDSEAKKVFYSDRKNQLDKGLAESKTILDMVPFPQDSYSAIFFVRTLPLEDGKVYTFPVVSEGRGWECVVTVVRREMMDTPLGRKQTIVIRPQTRFNGVLKEEGSNNLIWLTDDDRRLIVRLEAKIKIGFVAARLKKVELGVKPSE